MPRHFRKSSSTHVFFQDVCVRGLRLAKLPWTGIHPIGKTCCGGRRPEMISLSPYESLEGEAIMPRCRLRAELPRLCFTGSLMRWIQLKQMTQTIIGGKLALPEAWFDSLEEIAVFIRAWIQMGVAVCVHNAATATCYAVFAKACHQVLACEDSINEAE